LIHRTPPVLYDEEKNIFWKKLVKGSTHVDGSFIITSKKRFYLNKFYEMPPKMKSHTLCASTCVCVCVCVHVCLYTHVCADA